MKIRAAARPSYAARRAGAHPTVESTIRARRTTGRIRPSLERAHFNHPANAGHAHLGPQYCNRNQCCQPASLKGGGRSGSSRASGETAMAVEWRKRGIWLLVVANARTCVVGSSAPEEVPSKAPQNLARGVEAAGPVPFARSRRFAYHPPCRNPAVSPESAGHHGCALVIVYGRRISQLCSRGPRSSRQTRTAVGGTGLYRLVGPQNSRRGEVSMR